MCAFGSKSLLGSEKYIDSLVKVINTSRNESDRLHAMVNLSRQLVTTNRDSTLVLLNAAAKLASDPDPARRARYYNSWGLYYWYNREPDKAMENYARVFELPETDELLSQYAEAANNMGILLTRGGLVDSAGKMLHEALRIDIKRNYPLGVAKTKHDLASFYLRQDKFELALRYILVSIDYFAAIQDQPKLTRSYNILGNIYGEMGESDKALEAYYKSEALADEEMDKSHIVTVLNNIFLILANNSKQYFDEALIIFDKAFAIAEEIDDKAIMLVLYTNKALLYDGVGDLQSALYYLRLARSFEDLPAVRLYYIASLYGYKGSVHRKLNNLDSAKYFLNESLELGKTLNTLSLQANSYFNLTKVDSLQGNYLAALHNYQLGHTLHDSIFAIENRNRIAELEIIYQTEKKESENASLRESNLLKERVIRNQQLLIVFGSAWFLFFLLFVFNLVRSKRKLRQINIALESKNAEITAKQEEINRFNQELVVQKRELEELNRTKDKFFSVIAHDLRGPFSGLINLLDLVLNEFDTMTEDEKKAMLATIYRSSENTFNLIVNLLEWSQAQRGMLRCEPIQSNVKNIIQDALAVLSTRIEVKQHTVAVHVNDNLSCFCDPDLTKSIFINLINNAIKFTPRNGLIEIYGESSNGSLTLSVRDNGIGVHNAMLDSLFKLGADNSRKGTEGEVGTGLGLVMVKDFIKMQNGSLSVKSTVGEGTTFSITLPTEE